MDITFAGLREQTYTDFELILVDHRFEKRRAQVRALAKSSGVRTIHVPEHRRNGKWGVVAAAWNTGFMLADGDITIMMPDFTYVPPTWIERHLKYHDSAHRVFVISPYTMLVMPPVVDKEGKYVSIPGPEVAASLPPLVTAPPDDRFNEISLFSQPFDPSWVKTAQEWPIEYQCYRHDPGMIQAHLPLYGHIHFRNESMRTDSLLQMHGFDETLDLGKSHIDIEFGRRVSMMGIPTINDWDNRCWMFNPRTLFPTMPQTGASHRWTWQECEAYAIGTSAAVSPVPRHFDNIRVQVRAMADHLGAGRSLDMEDIEIHDQDYYGKRD